MTDNENVSKIRVPITLCIFSMPMLLDSIVLWITTVLLWNACPGSGDISTYVSTYAFLTVIPWIIVHSIFVIGGIIVKIVSKKKWFGSIGLWLCLMSILHVIIRALPFLMVIICEIGKSV